MKFAVFAALAATAEAAIHADCTMTWKDAKDPACDAATEQCFDWQNEDKSASTGLYCGTKTNCGQTFKWSDGTDEKTFNGVCDGLSMADCSKDKTVCDTKAEFQCADWTDSTGKTTIGCARKKECGTSVNSMTVACTGLLGDACKTDAECDQAAKYKCGIQFNNQTYAFVEKADAACAAPDSCGKKVDGAKDNNTILLCYGEAATPCASNKTCDKPDGDSGDVICGYLAPGDMKTNVTSFCVDKKYCPDAALNGTGANVTYFGAPTKLWCGSARTALAMGAAAISAYLAM